MKPTGPSGTDLQGTLLPFAPLLYVAWADGVLTPSEIESIRSRVEAAGWLDQESKTTLSRWLDPAAPPSAGTLTSLLTHIRRAASSLSPWERRSLTELGFELARADDEGVDWTSRDARRALEDIEDALAGPSEEVTREILLPDRLVAADESPAPASFDLPAMTSLLRGHDPETRTEVFQILRGASFRPRYDLS
jgi:acyl-CoA oxidase